ncbi:hypothetical protein GG851_12105 [Bordetella petrii]|uniref:DUF4238 domain-containing protein n=1 Tax=Bordetella petrii (strain ATCC BAA-461 / DSM 12804 / CCUG 43448 / CIP 107267 / Se-1111R) TaxID=340100 RepID=A9IF70_BORPD|nr:hypothetical protein [Bordetella petrii]MBO1112197.1 hypothetical protein [Bordetella petrii]MBO9354734.1 hypothetical protein [Bordetella petrii]CAP44979.1 conserved hypothetical protein [Bordetella petrii]
MNQPIFERTQKGNPHHITINQHIHSKHCIKQFCGKDGLVDVREMATDKVTRAKPEAKVFCTKRAWDDVTEKSRMAGFERAYFNVLTNPSTFESRNHEAISAYYLLWHFRFLAATADRTPLTINGVVPERELDINSRELLESRGIIYMNEDATMSTRFIYGARFYLFHDREMERLRGTRWGLVHCRAGELLCADNHGGHLYMPISPTAAFLGGYQDGTLTLDDVQACNRLSVATADNWLFARDLQVCPL